MTRRQHATPWLLLATAVALSACAATSPQQTSVFGPGGYASTATPPIPYANQGRHAPLQTLNSTAPGAATAVSGPF